MPDTNYLKIRIGNREVEVEQSRDLPIAVSYELEDPDNFEQKKSSSAFDLTIPATQNNSQSFNSPHNLTIEDLTSDEFFTSHMPCRIEANGIEILTGKAFLKEATHTDRPQSIVINCYGNNADWLIDLKEATLYDFVNPATHVFNATNIQNSWNYSGLNEISDFVYAPVRYKQPFQTQGTTADMIVTPTDLKPAISPYWILYRAFKSLGYRINSFFLDSVYFRRQVLPWTWGSFLYFDDDVKFPYMFRAMCTKAEIANNSGTYSKDVSPNDGTVLAQMLEWKDVGGTTGTGGFQNSANLFKGPGTSGFPSKSDLNYYYPSGAAMGTVAMGFELKTHYSIIATTGTNTWNLLVQWYVFRASSGTTTMIGSPELLFSLPSNGTFQGDVTATKEITINPGDIVTARMVITANSSTSISWAVGVPYPTSSSSFIPSYFKNTYVKKALGSVIGFKQYAAFKNYKFLDLLRGLIDFYNLSITTDTTEKVVTIEPTYDYKTQSLVRPGYYKSERLQWADKQDLAKESTIELYADNEREFNFRFKEDTSDGALQILNKRFNFIAGDSKYLFPERFKSGSKEYVNRFFSPAMHVIMSQWAGITSIPPQLITLIPENISNTSSSEQEATFQPKLAYYRGNQTGFGGWIWQPDPTNSGTITNMTSLPFMFAVNYLPGGESDPILTYSDQAFPPASGSPPGTAYIVASGLMRRFFLPRLAIMRHGKRYTTWMRLNLNDIQNKPHREAIIIGNSTYYLVSIEGYKPLTDESTQVMLWKYHPVMQVDSDNCFPSQSSVSGALTTLPAFDLKYARMLLFITDIPS